MHYVRFCARARVCIYIYYIYIFFFVLDIAPLRRRISQSANDDRLCDIDTGPEINFGVLMRHQERLHAHHAAALNDISLDR